RAGADQVAGPHSQYFDEGVGRRPDLQLAKLSVDLLERGPGPVELGARRVDVFAARAALHHFGIGSGLPVLFVGAVDLFVTGAGHQHVEVLFGGVAAAAGPIVGGPGVIVVLFGLDAVAHQSFDARQGGSGNFVIGAGGVELGARGVDLLPARP